MMMEKTEKESLIKEREGGKYKKRREGGKITVWMAEKAGWNHTINYVQKMTKQTTKL